MDQDLNIMRRALRLLSSSPKIRFSLISAFAIACISTFLLSVNLIGTSYSYEVGDIAQSDIRVPRDIEYVNERETAVERQREAQAVPLVFDKDASVLRQKLYIVGELFRNASETVKQYPQNPQTPQAGSDITFQVNALKARLPRYLQFSDAVLAEILKYGDLAKLKKIMARILIYIYNDPQMGVLDKPYDNPLKIKNSNVTVRTINTPEAVDETSRLLGSLMSINQIRRNIDGICYSIAPNLPKGTLHAVMSIIRETFEPNLSFNLEETRRRINEARMKVVPIKGKLKKGQTIVREGDTITQDILQNIKIYNKQTASINIGNIFGTFLVQLLFIFIFAYFLFQFNRIFVPDMKCTIIIFTLIVIFMVYTFLILRMDFLKLEPLVNLKLAFPLMLPISYATMIVSILYNRYLSILVGIFIVFFTTVIGGSYTSTSIIAFSTALVGVFVVENVEKRTDLLRGGLIIGLVNVILVYSMALIQEIPVANVDFAIIIGIAVASGIFNSILVLGLLPLYENLFGITTKFKLLELSDLNADIFKEMLMKAPGTYNHSMIVSTIAEAACKEIRANHLLARVGANYHDIGKIEDAGMYIENGVTDPRSKLFTPKEYARLIISHVEKGAALAEANGLPGSVVDFIREHHGETTMTFFYHQSLENADARGHGGVQKSDFQYPGPKPRSKESAVVMLADSVEAAARSLQNPSYEKLEGLVRKIVYNKLNDGELEFSDLSMTELNIIQNTFLSFLKGIFHSRIEYPEEFDLKKLEKKKLQSDDMH
jgi:putative nucleotidyltransferase with HDIG domain